jgi:pyrroline-5-carboxylate reductase
MIQGWINKGFQGQLAVASPNSAEKVAQQFGIQALDASTLVEQSDVIVLAFLPQQLNTVIEQIGVEKFAHKLILSTLGSTTQAQLAAAFPNADVVRTMPNVNSAVNQGVTAMVVEHQQAHDLLQALGAVVIVSEAHLVNISAIAGSGPAFVAAFVQAFNEKAVALGIPQQEAQILVNQTFFGTMVKLLKEEQTPEALMQQVASPGGSTEQGLQVIEATQVPQIIDDVIQAAIDFH